MPGEKVQIARLGFRQAVLVAVVSGVFGLAAAAFQLAVRKPATEARVVSLFNERLPVGTIVASMLDPKTFAEVAGDAGDFATGSSTWVPADGREVTGCLYAKKVGTLVPDLRGMFLRGLNYSEANRVRSDGDPDGTGRKPGDLQKDDFAAHHHPAQPSGQPGSGSELFYNSFKYEKASFSGNTGVTGGKETRPRNVAVYYYIKIN